MRTIQCHLQQLLDDRGISQNEIARETETRVATIHQLCHNESKRIPREVIEKIADKLEIDDINEILTIEHK
ncbi:MAG TPA: helix-turn-helix transcriptional regulator [Bacillales bacterium]|nr:helix-turn-helix transcriptional regulator [Bacillales bacterium]